MAGQDRRHNAHKLSKKQERRMGAMMFARMKKALGLDKLLDVTDEIAIPREKINRSKYKPHQGAQEMARRVRQGNAPLNMNVVAKPSQDFSKSHWNNAQMRKAVEANNAS